jgi:hypothetical protein
VVLDRYARWRIWSGTMPNAPMGAGCLVDSEVHEDDWEDTNPS